MSVLVPEVVPAKKPACSTSAVSETAVPALSAKSNGKKMNKSGSSKVKELSAEEKLQKDKCTLFVGNVPMTIAKRKFEAPFKQFGTIVSSRFRSVPVKDKYRKSNKKFGVMKKDFVNSDETKLSQNGYIVFASEDSVNAAIEGKLHGTDAFQSGHMIRLDYVVKPTSGEDKKSTAVGAVRTFDRKKSIYIPHLPADVCDVDVTAAVESADASLAGTVRGVRIVRTQKSGTFAFVLFSDRCHATKAIKMSPKDGFEYAGFGNRMKVKLQRILKDGELAEVRAEKQKEMQESAKIAAKKSLSRVKWQARLTQKGIAKVVSHHVIPRKERQQQMKGAALRLSRKNKA